MRFWQEWPIFAYRNPLQLVEKQRDKEFSRTNYLLFLLVPHAQGVRGAPWPVWCLATISRTQGTDRRAPARTSPDSGTCGGERPTHRREGPAGDIGRGVLRPPARRDRRMGLSVDSIMVDADCKHMIEDGQCTSNHVEVIGVKRGHEATQSDGRSVGRRSVRPSATCTLAEQSFRSISTQSRGFCILAKTVVSTMRR